VGGLRLGDLAVRLRLDGVDEIDELDSVLDEEDGDVVADYVCTALPRGQRSFLRLVRSESVLTDVPITLVGVEPHGHATGVAHGVGATPRSVDGGETYISRRDPARIGEDLCTPLPAITV
jgi:hypothetical protein